MGLKELQLAYGTDKTTRVPNDFYETRECDTRVLLLCEPFEGMIWEPAAGRGAMAKVIDETYEGQLPIRASDKFEYPEPIFRPIYQRDFLWRENDEEDSVENVITNPPFTHAEQFLHQALFVARRKVALLVRLNFLEGRRRKLVFAEHPPKRVLIFSNRIGFVKNGVRHDAGMMPHCWVIWDKNYCERDTRISWVTSEMGEIE